MIAVLFEVTPQPGRAQRYFDSAAALADELERIEGFVSVERFESLTRPGTFLSLSCWRTEDAVARWRNHVRHRRTQALGRSGATASLRTTGFGSHTSCATTTSASASRRRRIRTRRC